MYFEGMKIDTSNRIHLFLRNSVKDSISCETPDYQHSIRFISFQYKSSDIVIN